MAFDNHHAANHGNRISLYTATAFDCSKYHCHNGFSPASVLVRLASLSSFILSSSFSSDLTLTLAQDTLYSMKALTGL